jgi:hypothetical protein
VPTSALGAPLSSGARYLAGAWLFAGLRILLELEARLRGGALVYVFHTYEFARKAERDERPWHQRMYTRDPAWRYRVNLRLLEDLLAQADVEPLPASEYLERLEGWPRRMETARETRWWRRTA